MAGSYGFKEDIERPDFNSIDFQFLPAEIYQYASSNPRQFCSIHNLLRHNGLVIPDRHEDEG
jgi:hypothetical protein